MKMSKLALILVSLFIVSTSLPARAGSHTWSGAMSVYFDNSANWSIGGAPTANETNVVLNFPANATRYVVSNNIVGLTVAAINLVGDNYGLLGNSINISGTGQTNIASWGALNYMATPLVLASSNVTVYVDNNLTFYLNGVISGTGSLIKVGSGTLQFNGTLNNTYTGTTYINSGTLLMSRGTGQDGAVPGALVIGTATGSAGTAIAKTISSSQIGNTSMVTVNSTGILDINNAEAIGGLTMAGAGQVQTGTNGLTLMGDISVQTGTETISGNVQWSSTNRTINVVPGGTLNISARIQGYAAGLIKTGAGGVNLQGPNTFDGPVIVKQGYLSVSHNQGLGHSSGLTVTNIAVLQLLDVSITNITATISGNGNGNGAVRAFGTNVWAGHLVLGANAGIQCYAVGDLLSITDWIFGPGGMTKIGAGKLVIAGIGDNTYQGATTVSQGTLQLSKTNFVAIPKTLIVGDATNAAYSRIVLFKASEQVADNADVIVNASGVLEFSQSSGVNETLGSLAGAGNVNLGPNHLAVGTNNFNTVFTGSISGFANSSFLKLGTGQLSLNGSSAAFQGWLQVKAGILSVNDWMASSLVFVSDSGTLSGSGIAGPISVLSGKLTPGNSTGFLTSADLGFGVNGSLELELNGLSAGLSYDQVKVTGVVNLGNASLHAMVGFQSAISNKFVIIVNDGNDSVVGTFKGLNEGVPFVIGNALFTISYHGGDGNDVELTQISAPIPAQIGGITQVAGGQMNLGGSGLPGTTYTVEANVKLSSPGWTNIGTALCDPQTGKWSFVDVNAQNFPARFYRLVAP